MQKFAGYAPNTQAKKRTRNFLQVAALALLCASCSYTKPPTTTEVGSQVGATGDVGVSHEPLGNDKHLLTVTAAPGLLETEGSIGQRIHISATRFAARTCTKGFDFVNDPNLSQPGAAGFMKRTRSYVFVCHRG